MTLDWDKVARDRYDAWRTTPPAEEPYDFDEYCDYVDTHPESGYNAESLADYQRWVELMQQEDEDAEVDVAAARAEADREADFADFWGSL